MRFRALAVAAGLAAAAAAPALAQAPQAANQGDAPPGWPEAQRICSADLDTYCPKMQPGLWLGLCLRKNFDKMSPNCQSALESLRDQQQKPQG
jgi:hypothetical protein